MGHLQELVALGLHIDVHEGGAEWGGPEEGGRVGLARYLGLQQLAQQVGGAGLVAEHAQESWKKCLHIFFNL